MQRNITMIILVAMLALWLIACHSGGGSGDSYPLPTITPTATATATTDPVGECFSKLQGTWYWSAAETSSSGVMQFDSWSEVSGIAQNTCPGMGLVAKDSNSYVSGNEVHVIYTVVCNNKSYTYEMVLEFVNGNCNWMKGTRKGTYAGAITENISLTKQ